MRLDGKVEIMTNEEIDEVFRAMGTSAREADLEVVQGMGGTPEVLGEYIWDHYMGEPDSPTVEEVQHEVRRLVLTMDKQEKDDLQGRAIDALNQLIDAESDPGARGYLEGQLHNVLTRPGWASPEYVAQLEAAVEANTSW
jgi:hypothetical protein